MVEDDGDVFQVKLTCMCVYVGVVVAGFRIWVGVLWTGERAFFRTSAGLLRGSARLENRQSDEGKEDVHLDYFLLTCLCGSCLSH